MQSFQIPKSSGVHAGWPDDLDQSGMMSKYGGGGGKWLESRGASNQRPIARVLASANKGN